ncbi:hypothetical protein V8B97DRAFT_1986391 [Scleroderma yunnanense]
MTTETEEMLRLASSGFDLLFANDLDAAMRVFSADGQDNSPFHLMGMGVCAFLKAALGMEAELMEDATRCLALSEQGAKKYLKLAKSLPAGHRFQPGIEWEVLHTDAVVLLGLTHALSESYRGYLQCLYELNSAHSKFNKLFKTLYPNGLDAYATPSHSTPVPSRIPSQDGLKSSTNTPVRNPGFFARWTGFPFGGISTPQPIVGTTVNPSNGPVEELILSGAAFGYGLFNLVLSLLPAKIRHLVGFLGYNHDRQLALRALAVSAARSDVHAIFSGLVLMTYYGVVLLMSGYQADEEHIVRQYKGIVQRVSERYPDGSLWILNKAKIQRMTSDTESAIATLQEGLQADRQTSFPQADTLLAFELAWTLLQSRRYEESAMMFSDLTNMNNWSHATYQFLAAGCYVSIGELSKAQKIFDGLPGVMDRRRGRQMPTEVFIKKKLAFYKHKQVRRGGDPRKFAESMKISPAEELAIAWNTHSHANHETALAHIKELSSLTPPVGLQTVYMTSPVTSIPRQDTDVDLDTPDELAVRSLILGIVHRTLGDYTGSRALLHDALGHWKDAETNSWVGGVTYFELAVLDMKEGERVSTETISVPGGGDKVNGNVDKRVGGDRGKNTALDTWRHTIWSARETLQMAHALCTREVDLSSRLDSRIVMLREEIEMKMKMVGLSAADLV